MAGTDKINESLHLTYQLNGMGLDDARLNMIGHTDYCTAGYIETGSRSGLVQPKQIQNCN